MKRNTLRIVTAVLALALALSCAACGGKTTTTDPGTTNPAAPTAPPAVVATPIPTTEVQQAAGTTEDSKYGGTFSVGRSTTCSNFCNLYGATSAENFVFPAVETLIRWSDATGTYEPLLAESYDIDLDKCTLTFHLRDGVKFHDGSVCDAEAVKWNIDTWIENRGAGSLGGPTEIEAPDAKTVVVHYETPAFGWDTNFAQVFIYSKEAIEKNGPDWAATHIVGTGPFVFESYKNDQGVYFDRNDNYWQEGLPYLDHYRVMIFSDWTSIEAAFINGEVDYFNCADATVAAELIGMGYKNYAVAMANNYMTITVFLNDCIEGDPFNDKRVREAVLVYGVDWEAVGFAAKQTLAERATQIVAPGSYGYIENYERDERTYDLDKAKALLAEAGYPDGFKTTLYAATSYTRESTALQAELAKLGIEAEIVVPASITEIAKDRTAAGLQIGAWVNTVDPTTNLMRKFAPKYYDIIDYTEEYMTELNAVRTALSAEEKDEHAKKLFHILFEDICSARAMYQQKNSCFLTEGAIDSGTEYKQYWPEKTYFTNK